MGPKISVVSIKVFMPQLEDLTLLALFRQARKYAAYNRKAHCQEISKDFEIS
ncbi:MAG: hypothetical protein AAB456_01295 [Patescibacteria group bacterium]